MEANNQWALQPQKKSANLTTDDFTDDNGYALTKECLKKTHFGDEIKLSLRANKNVVVWKQTDLFTLNNLHGKAN